MNKFRKLTLTILLLGLFVSAPIAETRRALGQAPAEKSAEKPEDSALRNKGGAYYALTQDGRNYYGTHQQATKLAHDYVKAEKEEAKRDIRKKLNEVLNQQFDAHLKQQKKELEELEKQLETLRSVLQKRQDAKEKIVERRFEQLVQEAAGLGWQDGPPRAANQWEAARPYSPAKR
jgi:hypothetical protein